MSTVKKILIGFGGLLALILLTGLLIFFIRFLTTGPLSVIDRQLAALAANDFVQAYEYTSKDFKDATSLVEFQAFIYHYPILKNSDGLSVLSKESNKNEFAVRGYVRNENDVSLAVEYLLTKEEGDWKVVSIQVNPQSMPRAKSEIPLSNQYHTFDNADSRYSIVYPGTWEYEVESDATVIFSGKRGTPAYYSTVNIQTVLSKKTGGQFATVSAFMNDIKHQASTESQQVKFLEQGTMTLTEKNGHKDTGLFIVFTYKYKNEIFKQWQIVVLRHDGQVFYAWAYTSPIDQYDNDLTVVKAMLRSWVVY